jgi:thioredoxin reductase (NADPH)
MSRYLIRRIDQTPNISLLAHTEIVGLEGGDHLEHVRWRNDQAGEIEKKNISHVFLMTGANPNTGWLQGCVALDDKGFIKDRSRSLAAGLERRWVAVEPAALPA